MDYSIIERKAVNRVEEMFLNFKWYFREQPLLDYGVDAIVETSLNNRPSGKFIAVQIKGGSSHFYRTKEYLTFYFSETHCAYWISVNKNLPLFLIIYDNETDNLYWFNINNKSIISTKKGYKVEIPIQNILNLDSKTLLEEIIGKNKSASALPIALLEKSNNNNDKKDIEITISNIKELLLNIKLKNYSKTIKLLHKPKRRNWDFKKGKLEHTDPYYFCIERLIKFIKSEFNQKYKRDSEIVLEEILSKVEQWVLIDGLYKISEIFFDRDNQKTDIPKFKQFVEAFEFHSKLEKGKYDIQILDSCIIFIVKNKKFIIDTYEGKKIELKSYFNDNSFDEICTMTDEWIWEEIYIDAGIEKGKFIPALIKRWESYWDELYQKINQEIGYTSHLDKLKERSWREFSLFTESYNDSGNIIELAYEFDESRLYPLSVLTMLDIFNLEICLDEYCELEFFAKNEWESIDSSEYSNCETIFFIKEYEI